MADNFLITVTAAADKNNIRPGEVKTAVLIGSAYYFCINADTKQYFSHTLNIYLISVKIKKIGIEMDNLDFVIRHWLSPPRPALILFAALTWLFVWNIGPYN